MRTPVIIVLAAAFAVAAFWIGRASRSSVEAAITPTPVVRPSTIERIPVRCNDTMRFALAAWQQVSDTPFANEIKTYLTSAPGSLVRRTAQQDLAGEAAKLWAIYDRNGGRSRTIAPCLAAWLRTQPGGRP